MAELVEVAFVPAGRRVWVRPGTTLVAAGLAAEVEIVTGCTEGMCGTDPVRVLAGAEGLSAAEPHELGTLERMGLGADYRLACSAKAIVGTVEVATDSF